MCGVQSAKVERARMGSHVCMHAHSRTLHAIARARGMHAGASLREGHAADAAGVRLDLCRLALHVRQPQPDRPILRFSSSRALARPTTSREWDTPLGHAHGKRRRACEPEAMSEPDGEMSTACTAPLCPTKRYARICGLKFHTCVHIHCGLRDARTPCSAGPASALCVGVHTP